MNASGRHEDTDLGIDGFRHLGTQLLAWPGYAAEPVEVVEMGGFTSDWVRTTGLQTPSLVKGCTTYTSFLQPLLTDMRDLSLLSKELGHDREVQTLDVAQQTPGPRWTMRQWCLYWKERQTLTPQTEPHHLATGPGGASDAPHFRGSVAPAAAAAAGGGVSSADDGGNTEMDDEADSAFVHQGDVDQFRETSAPRKGIRDSNKRRLLALTYAPLPDSTDAPAAAAAAALQVPPPLAAADLVAHVGLSREVMAAATGGGGSAASVAAARHHVAVWPAGAATNFRLLPGGAASWWAVAHGRMVFLLVPPTEQSLALFATWSASGARDHGVPFLDAWGPLSPPPFTPLLPPPLPTHYTSAAAQSVQPAATSPRAVQRSWAGGPAPDLPPGSTSGAAGSPPASGLARVVRLEAGVGDVAVLPAGWPFAVVAVEDSVAVCGQMLSIYALGAALRCWELEDLLGVKQRARFPMFKHVMWHAAVTYAKTLRSAAGLPMLKRQRASTSRDRGGNAIGYPAMTLSHNPYGGSAGGARRLAAAQPQGSAMSGGPGAVATATSGGRNAGRGAHGVAAAGPGRAATAATSGADGKASALAAVVRRRSAGDQYADSARRQSTAGGDSGTAAGQAATAGGAGTGNTLLPPRGAVAGRGGGKGASPSSPQYSGGGKRLRHNTGAAVRMFNQLADDEDDVATATSPRERLQQARPRSNSGAAAAGGASGPDGSPMAAGSARRMAIRVRNGAARATEERPRRRAAQGRNWGYLLTEEEEGEGEGEGQQLEEGEGEGGGVDESEGSHGRQRHGRWLQLQEDNKAAEAGAEPNTVGRSAPKGGRGGRSRRRRAAELEDSDYECDGSEHCSDGMSHGSDGGGAMRTPGGGRARRRLSDGGSEGSTPASLGYRRGRGGSGKKQGRSGRGLTPGTQVGVGVSVGSGAGHRLRLPIVPRHATPSLDIGVVNSRPGTAPSVRRHITTAREYHAEGAGASIHAQHQPFRGPWRARRTQVYDGTEDNNLSPDEAQSDDSGSGRQHRMGACRQRKGGDGNVSGEEAGSGLAQGLSPGRAGSCGAFGEGLEAALEDSISSERDSGQLQRRRCVWQRRRRQAHAVGEDDDELADVACVDAAGGGMEASNGSEGSRGLAAEGLLPSPAEAVPHVGRRRLRRALVNDEDGDMHGTTAGGEPPPLPTAEAHQIAAAVPIKIKLFRPCAAQGGPTHPPHRTCQPADPSSRSPSPVPIPRRPFTGRELGLRTGGSGAVGTGASGGSSTPGAGAGLGTGAGPGPGAGGSHGLKLRLKLPVGTFPQPPNPHPDPPQSLADPHCGTCPAVAGSHAAVRGGSQGPSGGTQLPEERVSLRDVAVIPRGTIAAHAPRPTAIIALTSFPQPVQQHTGDLTPVGHGPMPASLRELEPRIPNAELQAEVSTYGANATVGLECNAASEAIPQLDGAGDLDEDSYDVMGSGRTSNSAPDGCHQSPPAASMSLSARLRHNLRSDLFPSARGAGGEACAAFLSALEPTSPRTAGVLTSSLSRIPGGSPKAIDLDGPADTGPSPTSLLSFPPTQLQQQQPQQSTQMLQPDTAITAFLPQQQPARPGHLSILQKLPPEPSAGAVPPLSSPSGHHPQNLHMPTSATQDYPWQQSDVVSREAQVRIPQALASPEAATPFLFNQPQQQPQPNQFQSLQEMNRANILAVPAAGGPAAPASLQAIASAGRTLAPASEPAAQQDTCNKAFQRRLPMPASEAVVAAAEHQGQHSNVALGQVHAGSTRSVAAAPSLQPLPQVRQTGENAGSDAAAEAGAMEIAGAAPGAALGPSSAPQFVSPASPGLDGSSAVPAALPSTGRGAGISPPALLVPPPPRSVSGGGAAVPAKRGADGAAKAAPVRPGPGRPHVVKSISEAVPDAQKAVGLMPLGAHRTAQQSVATPKGSLSRMIPGRQGQQQRTPPSGLLAAAKQQQVATPTGLAGSRPVAGLAAAANAGMGRTLGARVPGADGGGASPTAGVVTRSTAGPQFAGGSGGGLNGMASRPPHPHPALQQGESMVLGSVSGTASGLVQAPSKVSTPVSVPLAQAPHQQHATPDGATAIQLAIRTAIAGTLQRYDMPPPSNTPTTMLTAAAAAPPLLPTAASPSVSAVAIIGSAISAGSAAPPAPKQRLPLPRLLSPWEIRDIPLLVTALRRGLAESPYHDDVPFTVRDPEHALEQLEEALTVLEHPAFAAAPTGPALLAPSADCTLMASGALATAGASGDVEGVGVGPSVSGMPMGPPPRPLPLAARAPPAVAAASSRAAPYPTIRFASDAELPPVWRQLRDRLAAQRAQSPGPGSTAIGTTLDGDTVEQIAETDPAASAGVGGPGGPGGGRHHPQRSAGRAGAAQPVSKKMAKLRKGLGLS